LVLDELLEHATAPSNIVYASFFGKRSFRARASVMASPSRDIIRV
jgi:hypothetical protein